MYFIPMCIYAYFTCVTSSALTMMHCNNDILLLSGNKTRMKFSDFVAFMFDSHFTLCFQALHGRLG